MPRWKRVFNSHEYVTFNAATNKSTCLICKKVLCGFIIGNIKRHYEKMHDFKFEKRFSHHTNTTATDTKTLEAIETTQASTRMTANNGAGKEIKLNKGEFLKCCVGLITVTNLPLRIFDDVEFFKKLISPYEDEFNINLNSTNIVESVEFWAERVKLWLKDKFNQKLLCLNIDVANRMRKNVMVINVQTMERYEFKTYTLGVVQLQSKNNTQFLKDEILKCLGDFNIDLKQVYSVTGDGRGCTLSTLNLIQQELEDSQYEKAMATDESETASEDFKSTLSIIKCGYHTIKMAAREFFATVESSLSEFRAAVGMIREKYSITEDIPLPSLDNTSRWESTYEMVCILKTFMAHYKLEFKIEWIFVEAFLEALTPLVECSKQLRTEEYIIGDFYRDWLVCEAKLRKMKHNEHAIKLLSILLDVKQNVLCNEAFNAALYFDPRFNYTDSPYFTDDRKKLAVDHIVKSHAIGQEIKTDVAAPTSTNDYEIANETIAAMWTEDPYNILEEELHSISKSTYNAPENLCIRQKLENLAYTQRQPFSTNILEYWKNRSIKDQDVHNILKIILAIPISQASIERAHSALSTVLTKQKSNISKTNLGNILLVKLNGNVLADLNY